MAFAGPSQLLACETCFLCYGLHMIRHYKTWAHPLAQVVSSARIRENVVGWFSEVSLKDMRVGIKFPVVRQFESCMLILNNY